MEFKDYKEFTEFIKSCGIKSAEADYTKSTTAPYLVYFRDKDKIIYADSAPHTIQSKILVELYTAKTDYESEKTLEAWFAENGIYYQKTSRAWDVNNKLCVTYYDTFIWYKSGAQNEQN